MRERKISIVMPVHNTGIYLEESLSSVFNQTFQEFELICVDDCSKDMQTKEILKAYQAQYSNMTVLFLEQNVGAGEARNIGFSKAQGNYVIFLDADDVFNKNMLSRMYEKIICEDADVCECGYTEFFVENNKKVYATKERIPSLRNMQDRHAENWFVYQIYAPWNKLCRRNFLLEHKIFFQNIPSCNDVFFSGMALKEAKKLCAIPDSLVEYRTNSSNQISANRNPCNIFRAIELLSENLKKDKETKKQLFLMTLFLAWGEFLCCKNEIFQQQAYEKLKGICVDNAYVMVHSLQADFLREKIIKYSFEEKWFEHSMDFMYQLLLCRDEMKACLRETEDVYLWGLGKRGNAFQMFCRRENILLTGVTDKKNDAIGQFTSFGYEIMNTEDVITSSGIIVACNTKVYEELINKTEEKERIINLERYCPLPEPVETDAI